MSRKLHCLRNFADDTTFLRNIEDHAITNNCVMTLIEWSSGLKNGRCYSMLRNVMPTYRVWKHRHEL